MGGGLSSASAFFRHHCHVWPAITLATAVSKHLSRAGLDWARLRKLQDAWQIRMQPKKRSRHHHHTLQSVKDSTEAQPMNITERKSPFKGRTQIQRTMQHQPLPSQSSKSVSNQHPKNPFFTLHKRKHKKSPAEGKEQDKYKPLNLSAFKTLLILPPQYRPTHIRTQL